MYMQDGKPIQIPYGRRNVNVTRLELTDIVAGLVARIDALEAQVFGKVATTGYVEILQDEPGAIGETVEETGSAEPEKPKRGRRPKEATE